MLGERPGWRRFAGLGMGFAGVTPLMAGALSGGAALAAKLPGVAAILCTALMSAGGAVFAKRWPVQMAPVPLVARQIAIGTRPAAALVLTLGGVVLAARG